MSESLQTTSSGQHVEAGARRWQGRCAQGFTPVFIALLTITFGALVDVHAQPALQNALLNDYGLSTRDENRARAFEEPKGIETGPVRFSLQAGYALSLTDNVNHSGDDPRGDLIQTPAVGVDLSAPISQRSDLTLGLGVQYVSYWHTESRSHLTIAPDTELAYDVELRDVRVSLFDRLSYTEETSTLPDVANQATAPRWENTIGTQARWTPSHFVVTVGYSYHLTRTTDSDFEYLNRSSHLPFIRGGYVFARGAANAGMEFSSTFIDYESAAYSDGAIVSFGPYMDWVLSETLRASARGGLVYTVNSLSLLPDETLTTDSFYAGFNVQHDLTDNVFHSLDITHGVRTSYQEGARFTEETVAAYNLNWSVTDPGLFVVGLIYTHAKQEIGPTLPEEYDQVRFAVGLRYRIQERLSARVGYSHVLRDSDVQTTNRDYTENRVSVGVTYQFD